MDQIVHISLNGLHFDSLSMKIAPEEAAAQMETLLTLGNAILQQRELLESQTDYVARIELTIPMR